MPALIPPSLNKTNYTKTPFYLYLYGVDTVQANKWRGWTRKQVISDGECWVLPLPEKSFGANTELKASDEESVLSYPGVGGKLIGGTQRLLNSIGGAIPILGPAVSGSVDVMRGHGMGGAGVPMDFTAMTVYGTKKRSYRFVIDLYSMNSVDSDAIALFCRNIHSRSTIKPGKVYLGTPYVWTVSIWNDKDDVTENWLPDPGACAMISFSHSPTNFINTHEGVRPARSMISLTLTEIEPIASKNSGNSTEFNPTWGKYTL